MALGHFQQTAMAVSGTTLLGGCQMGIAASAASFAGGSMGTVLGIGNMTGFTENLEMTTTQAGNSNEPDKVIAKHTLTIAFELLEFYTPNWDKIRGGSLDTETSATAATYLTGTVNTFSTGGLSAIGEKALIFRNAKMVAGATTETVLVVYKAKIEAGVIITPKSDHDTDPVMVLPFTMTGELDTTRTAGDQLFITETELGV